MTQDLRAAVRLLRRRPGVSALVVLTLAIGISATTIVFSLADAILWRPLPFRDADRLIRVHVDAPLDSQRGSASNALAALDGAGVFEGLHPFALSSAIVNAGDEPQAVTIGELSPGLLETLAVNPVWGRDFAADEYQPGSAVVVVGAALWRRIPPDARRANDPLITVEGVPHTIVGVMPDGFEFPVSRVALWRPYVSGRPIPRIRALGRLKAGVTIEQARAIAATVDPREPGQARPTTQVLPFVLVNATTATALRLLLGAVALLLLIAVANVANVMLAEAVRRDPEFAVRASLGASRWRLTRQLLAEALVISALAAVAAAVASIWAIAALRTAVPYLWTFQALRPMAVDMRALAFAAAIAALAALGASGLSLLRASRRDLHRVLRVRASDTPGHGRARGFLTAS